MAQFHPIQVIGINRETADSVSITLKVPEALQHEFKFNPGQYLTFIKTIDGQEIRRSYSISSTPNSAELEVGIKRVKGGKFSTFATTDLKVGDTLLTMSPHGKFSIPAFTTPSRTVVAFAAGSGITPVLSILESTLTTEPDTQFLLFYGNSRKSTIMYRSRLDALKNRFVNRLNIQHILSGEELDSKLLSGRITAQKCKDFANYFFDPKEVDQFLICGPEAMINGVKEALGQLGVSSDRVHYELFTTVGALTGASITDAVEDESSTLELSNVTIIIDGHEFSIAMPQNGKTVLDAAADAGIDVPYSCKGAVCCTCMARVTQGTVHMTKNYSLTDREVESGLVLTCQAHPRTSDVVISFDMV